MAQYYLSHLTHTTTCMTENSKNQTACLWSQPRKFGFVPRPADPRTSFYRIRTLRKVPHKTSSGVASDIPTVEHADIDNLFPRGQKLFKPKFPVTSLWPTPQTLQSLPPGFLQSSGLTTILAPQTPTVWAPWCHMSSHFFNSFSDLVCLPDPLASCLLSVNAHIYAQCAHVPHTHGVTPSVHSITFVMVTALRSMSPPPNPC